MHDTVIEQVIEVLKERTKKSLELMTQEIIFLYGRDPYLILISCLLSLQTRDVITLRVSKALFLRAKSLDEMIALPLSELEGIIQSVNYYKTKALSIKAISFDLESRYGGVVPSNLKDLLSLKGVGLKTANLVLAEGFKIPAICVDTHVHRLANHWGLVSTENAQETERALREVLPVKYWSEWNRFVVKWGQSVCKKNVDDCKVCEPIKSIHRK